MYGATIVRPLASTMLADWNSKSAPWNRRPVESVKQLSTPTVPKHLPLVMWSTRKLFEMSSSWLPTLENSTPSAFSTSIVGSSACASTSNGQPEKLSPSAKKIEFW